jgi:hypothetical protein
MIRGMRHLCRLLLPLLGVVACTTAGTDPADAGLAFDAPGNIPVEASVPPDAGPPVLLDAAADTATDATANAPIDGLYIATCITVLSNQSPSKVLRFYTTVTGQGPSAFSISMKPMKGWTSNPPPGSASPPASVSATETLGVAATASNVGITNNEFSFSLGTVNIDGDANAISGRPITLAPELAGKLSAGQLSCAGMSGMVTAPVTITLEPSTNVCLFKKVDEGGPVPSYALSDFVCP